MLSPGKSRIQFPMAGPFWSTQRLAYSFVARSNQYAWRADSWFAVNLRCAIDCPMFRFLTLPVFMVASPDDELSLHLRRPWIPPGAGAIGRRAAPAVERQYN
jgi:hypothetical protein